MPDQSNAPSPDDDQNKLASAQNRLAASEENNPEAMDRATLERRIRGARRRSRMPGKDGKQGKMDLAKFEAAFKRRFKGAVSRFWDSVPPPRNFNKT